MIRLTVLYNLSPDTNEEEFLKWRLGKHQESNLGIEGVLRTDFALIDGAWPEGTDAPYRFITTMDWPDTASFKKGFYDPQVQSDLDKNLKKLSNPVFLISEILIDQKKESSES
ncbi:MAG: hypothetical protein E3J69_13390 [Anaerolineales bacterium]|nr:MAG: hypothetical protein E3J69_13390 [Anaerolineales bacterium]